LRNTALQRYLGITV